MYHIKLNKPFNFCHVSMTSWKFIICIVYFSVFCPYLVGAENYFLKNHVFQLEKILFEKNRNTEQIFLTSTPYLYCAIFYLCGYSINKSNEGFCFYISRISSVWTNRFKVFGNILHQFFLIRIFRAEELPA